MNQELLEALLKKEMLRRESIRVHRNLLYACIFLVVSVALLLAARVATFVL